MSGGNLNVLFAPIWDSRSLDGHEHKMCFRILDSDISLFELHDDKGLYFGCQMSSLFQNVLFGTISWQTWAQYFVSPPPPHPSFKIALPNLCRLFPPAGFGQKKTPGAFIALESLSTAAISLSLLPRRSDGVGCTDVINWKSCSNGKSLLSMGEKICQCLSLAND